MQAKANLGYATIYSPIDGVVLTRSYDIGQTVQARSRHRRCSRSPRISSFMQIDTSVAEGDVGRLADGMKATFTVDAFPGRTFDGTCARSATRRRRRPASSPTTR